MKSGDKRSLRLLGLTAAWLMRLWYHSCRKRFIDAHNIQAHFDSGQRFFPVYDGARQVPRFAIVVVALEEEVNGAVFVNKGVRVARFAGIPRIGCAYGEEGFV